MVDVLYVSIERHPIALQNLIKEYLENASLSFTSCTYEQLEHGKKLNFSEFQTLLLAPARHLPDRILDDLINCKLIQIWSSGYDKFNLRDAKMRNLKVANNFGANSSAVAEHTINMIFSLSRRNIEMHNRVLTSKWMGNDHGMSSIELENKTLGIIGFGKIGQKVATIGKALNMNTKFYDSSIDLKNHEDFLNFDNILLNSDILTLHLHLNEATRNIISYEQFDMMVKRPYLVNTSRAELINEDALKVALRNRLISGLAMDVHYSEPNSAESEIYKFTNSFFSPHIAGSTIDTYAKALNFCVSNIKRALNNNEVLGLI